MTTPSPVLFSLLHATARPGKWQESAEAWADKHSKHPAHGMEHIVAAEERFGPYVDDLCLADRAIVDNWPSSTQAYNAAAAVSTGSILIVVADDVFPPDRWDQLIMGALQDSIKGSIQDSDFVLWVSTGNPRDANLISQPILSRKTYERWGYLFYPQYMAMYADDDLTEHARQDGIVIDARDTVHLDHRHPSFRNSTTPWDNIYEHENRPESYAQGRLIIQRRREDHFSR